MYRGTPQLNHALHLVRPRPALLLSQPRRPRRVTQEETAPSPWQHPCKDLVVDITVWVATTKTLEQSKKADQSTTLCKMNIRPYLSARNQDAPQ